MTYKNTKFEDSPVMRSLEKLAQKKGLIKNDPFKKEASAPAPSYAPTTNLNQNILKLCSGLRSQGFGKYANELENKFLALKQAESIMEEAHPEGSVKLPDMEGDATIEDCADQKKMIEDIIKKTPKGKFGNDIVNLVKITLAQAVNESSDPLNIISSSQIQGKEYWAVIHDAVDKETSGWALQWSESFAWNTISNRIRKRFSYKPTDMTVDAIEKQFSDIKESVSFIENMGKESLAAGLRGVFGKLLTLYGPMRRARNQYDANLSAQRAGTVLDAPSSNEPKTIQDVTVTGDPVDLRIGEALTELKGYAAQIQADMQLTAPEKKNGINWLQSHAAKLKLQQDSYEKYMDATKGLGKADSFLKNIDVLEKQLKEFYQNWLA